MVTTESVTRNCALAVGVIAVLYCKQLRRTLKEHIQFDRRSQIFSRYFTSAWQDIAFSGSI